MPKTFIMRNQLASGESELLHFGGTTRTGYGYRLIDFAIFPGTGVGSQAQELAASITADDWDGNLSGADAADPSNPDFSQPGLIANAYFPMTSVAPGNSGNNILIVVINDLFVITQDIRICVIEPNAGMPVNYQCKFEEIKLNGPAQAVANFNQFTIYD